LTVSVGGKNALEKRHSGKNALEKGIGRKDTGKKARH
jgi:hypothetical protein